jgi:UDP-N-acetylglucosamine 2-epimerase
VLAGNPVCDLLDMVIGEELKAKKGSDQFVLLTTHRYENIYIKSRMKRILNIIRLSRLPIYWPVHETTLNSLRKFGLLSLVKDMNVQLLPLLDYPKFIDLLLRCKYVITDGGTIEEESLILGKPCLLLRKRTERGEGLEMGMTYLTKLDVEYSKLVIRKLEDYDRPNIKIVNPYKFGKSPSQVIVSYVNTMTQSRRI